MDAFEQLVSEILWMQGYWVRTSMKVELTKEDKQKIKLPTSPRWELDIVAYCARDNALYVVECKSYLDSRGVKFKAFDGKTPESKRFKLFNNSCLQQTVFQRLEEQLVKTGGCRPNPKIKLCLACGRIASETDRKNLRTHFEQQGWELWDQDFLKKWLHKMAHQGYENQMSAIVAKLLVRN